MLCNINYVIQEENYFELELLKDFWKDNGIEHEKLTINLKDHQPLPDSAKMKYIEKVDKSLVGIVKAFFAQSAKDTYSKLTPKQKTAFANAFIKIAADAMIDNEANKAQAAIVKGMKGFLTAKKTFIHQVMGDPYVSTYAAPTLVTQILAGNIGSVEDYLEALARSSGFYLSAYDVTKLFEYVTQTRYVRSQLTYNDDVNKAGYEEWISRQGGINPHSTEVHDFIGERNQFNEILNQQMQPSNP